MFFILQRRTVNTNSKVLSTVYYVCIRINMNLPICTYIHVLSEAESCKWKRNIANKHDELIMAGGGAANCFGNDIMLVTSNYWWQPAWHRCVIWLAAVYVRATRIYSTLHIGSYHTTYYIILHYSTTVCVNVYFSPRLYFAYYISCFCTFWKHRVWIR